MATPQLSYASSLQNFCAAVLAGERRLEAYSQNYLGAHVRALENTYPVTLGLLGNATFAPLAQVYVKHYPPQQWDLNLYGKDFAGLLQAQEQGGRSTDYNWCGVAGTARIEYAMTQAYYAKDQCDPVLVHIPLNVPNHLDGHDIGAELQRQHPFADIQQHLLLTDTVSVWRHGLRIRVSNQAPAEAPLRTGAM